MPAATQSIASTTTTLPIFPQTSLQPLAFPSIHERPDKSNAEKEQHEYDGGIHQVLELFTSRLVFK